MTTITIEVPDTTPLIHIVEVIGRLNLQLHRKPDGGFIAAARAPRESGARKASADAETTS